MLVSARIPSLNQGGLHREHPSGGVSGDLSVEIGIRGQQGLARRVTQRTMISETHVRVSFAVTPIDALASMGVCGTPHRVVVGDPLDRWQGPLVFLTRFLSL